MLISNLFLILLTGHILGDFYLQSHQMAEDKNSYLSILIKYSVIYSIVLLLVLSPVYNLFNIFIVWLISVISHLFIDLIKFFINKFRSNKNDIINIFDKQIFLIDQCLHIIILFIIVNIFKDSATPYNYINSFLSDYPNIFKFIAVLLLIGKPANIMCTKLFKQYKPEDDNDGSVKNAGACIGFLERVLIFILIYKQQYAAIGFVLTAKSIARYDKISKDVKFAEYYLLGTLASVIYALSVTILILKL